MSKPSTPVRRAKVGLGRPGSGGGEIPLTASMEVLTPAPSGTPTAASMGMDVGRSQDFPMPFTGHKARQSGSAPLTRTRSTDGRRSALLSQGPHGGGGGSSHGPHEVIPLVSTTAKSLSSNHLVPPAQLQLSQQQPLPSPSPSPYGQYGSSSGGIGGLQASRAAWHTPGAAQGEVGLSQASSLRFNPVTEGDDDASGGGGGGGFPAASTQSLLDGRAPGEDEAEVSGLRDSEPRVSRVVMGGSAAAVAQRAASAGASNRRYAAAAESVALSMEQQAQRRMTPPQHQQQQPDGEDAGMGAERRLGSAGRAVGTPEAGFRQGDGDNAEPPGTPGSVASGRVGGTFFTDLHRSFGDGSRLRLRGSAGGPGVDQSQDLGGMELLGRDGYGGRQPRASTMSSRLNPMQSPSASEDGDDDEDDILFAEYAGEDAAGRQQQEGQGEEGDASEEAQARASVLNDFSNPVQTPQDSRLATPLLPTSAGAASSDVRASLLNVIRDLYVTDPEPPPTEPEPEAEAEAAAEPSRPATALSVLSATEPEPEPEEDVDADSAEVLAASRAAVAALASRSESQQSRRRSELGEYMAALQGLKDDSGSRLVELPADWAVMIERLFRQKRTEFATLQGWMGPRRFEDLPINQLPKDHPDPKVEEGLARIRELDSVLNDKVIAALISHRETFPEKWAEQERKRLDRHSKGVEEALKRERQKRLRAARISRAVTSLDGPPSAIDGRASDGSLSLLAAQPSSVYSRLFVLKPEEEALVEEVLRRNDDEGAAINPFDLECATAFASSAPSTSQAGDRAASTASASGKKGPPAISVDDSDDDIEIEIAMMLPSSTAGSACVTPSTATAALLRPLSARAAERPGRGGSGDEEPFRPTSALSIQSFSMSRPGTSGSGAGGAGSVSGGFFPADGLSPIAAAALRGHPVFLAQSGGLRASVTGDRGSGGGLLPSRVYEDPRAAARALRVINARLAAFEAEHLWDESGSLADFKSISQLGPQPSQAWPAQVPLSPSQGPAAAGSGAAGSSAPAPAPGPPRPVSPSRSARSGGPAVSLTGVSVTEAGQRDYLREERVAKELSTRERDVDAALRQLKTGEVVRLNESALKAVVDQCRRLQELTEHRRKIEEAEAAARKAQQQRQLLMAGAGNGRGPRSPRTPKGAHTPPGSTPAGGPAMRSTTAATGAAAAAAGLTGASGTPSGQRTPGRSSTPPAGRQSGLSTSTDGSPVAAVATASASASASGSRVGAASGAKGGASRSGAGTAQRRNSAGSTGGTSGGHGSAASSGSSGPHHGTLPASRRASDPAMPGGASGPGATASSNGPAAHATSRGALLRASGGSVSSSMASVSGAHGGASGTPPKPKPSGSKPPASSSTSASTQSTSASMAVAWGFADASAPAAGSPTPRSSSSPAPSVSTAPGKSMAAAWGFTDPPSLPPPPPPPPPE